MGKLSILNEILDNLLKVNKELATRTRQGYASFDSPQGVEWGAVGGPHLDPNVSLAEAQTADHPSMIFGQALRRLIKQAANYHGQFKDDPYFFTHTHPAGFDPTPSRDDLDFLTQYHNRYDPERRMSMAVASPQVRRRDEPFVSEVSPKLLPDYAYVGPATSVTSISPRANYGELRNYLDQWYEARHHGPRNDERVLSALDPLMLPGLGREKTLELYDELFYGLPYMRAAEQGALDYAYDMDPAVPAFSRLGLFVKDMPNDVTQEVYDVVKRYGHLDYAQGGLVG